MGTQYFPDLLNWIYQQEIQFCAIPRKSVLSFLLMGDLIPLKRIHTSYSNTHKQMLFVLSNDSRFKIGLSHKSFSPFLE